MSKKARFWFFISSLTAFALIGTVLIAYSRGYRWQWQNYSFVQTGGIFIKNNQEAVKIWINGKGQNSNKRIFLTKGALLENLIPQTYEVSIEKEGYQSWYKQLPIEPGLVTEAKFILLFPSQLSKQQIDKVWNTQLYNLNNKAFIYLTTQGVQTLSLKIKEISSNQAQIIPLSAALQASANTEIAGISESNQYVLFKKDKPKLQWFLFDVQKQSLTALPLSGEQKVEHFEFGQSSNIYILSNSKLWLYSLKNQTLKQFFNKKIAGFTLDAGTVLYLNQASGSLEKIAQGGQNQSVVAQLDQSIFENQPTYQIRKLNDNNFLLNSPQEKFILVSVTPAKEVTQTVIDERVEQFIVDKKTEKIAYVKNAEHNFEVWVYYLKPFDEQPTKEATSRELITTNKERIGKIAWLEFDDFERHLLLLANHELKITELDGRDRRNSAILATGLDNFFYEPLEQLIWGVTKDSFWQARL